MSAIPPIRLQAMPHSRPGCQSKAIGAACLSRIVVAEEASRLSGSTSWPKGVKSPGGAAADRRCSRPCGTND